MMQAAVQRQFLLVLAVSAAFVAVPVDSAHALPVFEFSSTTTLAFPDTVVGETSAGWMWW